MRSPAPAYPSLLEAADLLEVSVATLLKQENLERVHIAGQTRIPAGEVLRLAVFYKKRPARDVYHELLERVATKDYQVRLGLKAELEQSFATHLARTYLR